MTSLVSDSDEIEGDANAERAGLANPTCNAPRLRIPPASVPLDDDQAALRFAAANRVALCTIVGIDGSFSRRLGAQLAIGGQGKTIVGSLADGCLEHELARQAEEAFGVGQPRLLRYGRGSPFVDFRFPCGSGLDVIVDPGPDQAALVKAVAMLDGREAATLTMPIEHRNSLIDRSYIPALRLLIFGAGPEAEALAQFAAGFGCTTEIVGPGEGLSLGQAPTHLCTDPWTAIVLLFHDHEWEDALLDWALGTPAFYIGSLGGRVARDGRREVLAHKGHSAPQIARIRSPIGLIPRARDAATLALSVLAEVVAEYEVLRP